jgi:predicted MFS family arabinose efflux permease
MTVSARTTLHTNTAAPTTRFGELREYVLRRNASSFRNRWPQRCKHFFGGVLFAAVGPRWVFALNALSFVVSAGLLTSVRGTFADPARSPALHEHGGLAAGFRFLARERVLRQMLASWVVFVLGTASTIVAEPLLADEFGAGSVGYGALMACWGGGTIVGAWLSRGVRRDREALWIVSFSGLMAATCFAVALSPWFWLILVWVAAFGLADGPTQVVEQNLLQRRTPDAVRGRVMGAWEAVMTVSFVAALLLGGVVVGSVGPKRAFIFAGILATAGSALLLPLLRWLHDGRDVSRGGCGSGCCYSWVLGRLCRHRCR